MNCIRSIICNNQLVSLQYTCLSHERKKSFIRFTYISTYTTIKQLIISVVQVSLIISYLHISYILPTLFNSIKYQNKVRGLCLMAFRTPFPINQPQANQEILQRIDRQSLSLLIAKPILVGCKDRSRQECGQSALMVGTIHTRLAHSPH